MQSETNAPDSTDNPVYVIGGGEQLTRTKLQNLAGEDPELQEIVQTLTDIQDDSRRAHQLKQELFASNDREDTSNPLLPSETRPQPNESNERVQDGMPQVATQHPRQIEPVDHKHVRTYRHTRFDMRCRTTSSVTVLDSRHVRGWTNWPSLVWPYCTNRI